MNSSKLLHLILNKPLVMWCHHSEHGLANYITLYHRSDSSVHCVYSWSILSKYFRRWGLLVSHLDRFYFYLILWLIPVGPQSYHRYLLHHYHLRFYPTDFFWNPVGLTWLFPGAQKCHTRIPSGPVSSTPYFNFHLIPCMKANVSPFSIACSCSAPAFLPACTSSQQPEWSWWVWLYLHSPLCDCCLRFPQLQTRPWIVQTSQASFVYRRCCFHCPLSI